MKISSLDLRIISAVELAGRRTPKQIAKLIRSKEHQVRYRLHKLREAGVLSKAEAVIDLSKLGITHHTVIFTLSLQKATDWIRIVNHLKKRTSVSWLYHMGGEFQFGVSISARTIHEVADELDLLSDLFGAVLLRKRIASQRGFVYFGRRYLGRFSGEIRFNAPTKAEEISAEDHLLLKGICEFGADDWSECCRRLHISRASFDRRRIDLEERGILKGTVCRVDVERLGRHSYLILITTRGTSRALTEQMYHFAERERDAVYLMQAIGAWDFEIGIEVVSPKDIADLSRRLFDEFGTGIAEVSILPVLEYYKFRALPQF
jgi:DNA-binding Lrp family transcriptional regulator